MDKQPEYLKPAFEMKKCVKGRMPFLLQGFKGQNALYPL